MNSWRSYAVWTTSLLLRGLGDDSLAEYAKLHAICVTNVPSVKVEVTGALRGLVDAVLVSWVETIMSTLKPACAKLQVCTIRMRRAGPGFVNRCARSDKLTWVVMFLCQPTGFCRQKPADRRKSAQTQNRSPTESGVWVEKVCHYSQMIIWCMLGAVAAFSYQIITLIS